jgi:hypothetical protein
MRQIALSAKRVFADAAVAVVLALFLASLAAAGIVTMGAAIFEIALGFGIGAFVILLSPIDRWPRIGLLAALGAAALALVWYENANYTPPLTKSDVRQAVEDGTAAHPFNDASQCPPGRPIFQGSSFYGNQYGVGIYGSGPHEPCFVSDSMHGGKEGLHIEP